MRAPSNCRIAAVNSADSPPVPPVALPPGEVSCGSFPPSASFATGAASAEAAVKRAATTATATRASVTTDTTAARFLLYLMFPPGSEFARARVSDVRYSARGVQYQRPPQGERPG